MRRTSMLASSFVLAIVLGLSVACSRKPDDAKVSSDIQNKFGQDSGLSNKQLTVQASDGVVTLAGTVDNEAQREAAGRQAASEPGVKTVINNLRVGSAIAAAPVPLPLAPVPTQSSGAPLANAAKPDPAKLASDHAAVAKPAPGKKSRKPKDADTAPAAQNPPADSTADHSGADSMTASNQTPPPAAQPDNVPAPADATPAAPPPPPSPKRLIIDQGTSIAVRLIDPIDTEKNQAGDTFHATLNAALTSDGEQAVPAGVEVTGHIVDVKNASKFAGQSLVVLQLDSLSSGGKTYSLQTDQYKKEGKSRGKNTAEKVGGGAVLGTLIGALAGGGKGAAIGAAAGAGAGGGVQAASKSQQIKLPSETVLNFTLQSPVEVQQAPIPNADRQKLSDAQ